MKSLILSALLALLLVYSSTARGADKPIGESVPEKVSVCDIMRNPGAYNHKLVEVSGNVSRGFEDFTLTNDCKVSDDAIWLDLGGKVGSQVVYCCGATDKPRRKKRLVVEGIPTTLVQDKNFRKFQKVTLIKDGYGRARVTLIGRFFSGEKGTLGGKTFWMGYGHVGFFSLLVIQQVVSVSKL